VSIRSEIEREGFALLPEGLLVVQTTELAMMLESRLPSAVETGRPGVRNVLEAAPELREWIRRPAIRGLASAILGDGCFPVRVILFDKTPEGNWRVPWHQDLSIAVRKRVDGAPVGWGPWSEKEGVVHVQPPVGVLEGMITTRLHLDNCGEENGPLRVLPGTHRLGRLGPAEIQAERGRREERICAAGIGDVIVMRPLLLHASSPARVPGRRRVLHVEWAGQDLPRGLEWFETGYQSPEPSMSRLMM